jgi:hypothetical protein
MVTSCSLQVRYVKSQNLTERQNSSNLLNETHTQHTQLVEAPQQRLSENASDTAYKQLCLLDKVGNP